MLLILKNKKAGTPKTNLFIKKISKQLSSRNADFSISSLEEIEIFIENKKTEVLINNKALSSWKTIFIRKAGTGTGSLVFILARLSKMLNIDFVDRFRMNTANYTKLIQMFLFSINKINIPKTYYSPAYDTKKINRAVEYLKFPIIAKQCNMAHGDGVRLSKNRNELNAAIKKMREENPNKEIILQEFIENDFEYRILVTGDKIATGEKKIRTDKKEFRNNIRLGAREEFIDVTKIPQKIKRLAIKAARVVDVQIAGVDIVRGKNKELAVFEVNSCPGVTYNEKISEEISKIADYLSSLCEKKNQKN